MPKISLKQGTRYSGTSIIFGAPDPVYGFVKDLTYSEEFDKEEISNGEGATTSIVYKNGRIPVSGTYTPKKESSEIIFGEMVGKPMTIKISSEDEIDIIVDKISNKRAGGAPGELTIEGTHYPLISTGEVAMKNSQNTQPISDPINK